METLIALKNVKKSYGKKVALRGVNLEVFRGEIFGLLGPNGAGKTTLIHILTGQLKSDNGNITVLNKRPHNFTESEFKMKVGVLSDKSALYERLSVYDNLKLFCKLYYMPLQQIEHALQLVNMEKNKKTRVNKLSKGMRQRVLLAKALIHEPEILFLDEPTSTLDPENRKYIHHSLRRLNEEGMTIFINTHDMDEAATLCDRVAFLNEGKIIELNKPRELQLQYATNVFHIETTDGKSFKITNEPENADHIANLIAQRKIKLLQSDLPSLGEVFLQATGKELVK